MFARLIAVLGLATVIAAGLLALRQDRLQAMHRMARLHNRMKEARLSEWDLQVRIAERLEPDRLRAAVRRAGLELEPAVPKRLPAFSPPASPLRPSDPGRPAEADHE